MDKNIIFCVLAVFGLHFSGKKLKTYRKWLLNFVMALYHLIVIHILLATVLDFKDIKDIKRKLPFIVISCECILIWILFYQRKNLIRKSILQIKTYKKQLNIFENKRFTYLVTIITISILFLPYINCAISFKFNISSFILNDKYWTYGYKAYYREIISHISDFLHFNISICFPMLSALLLNLIMYSWAEILKHYNNLLQNCLCDSSFFENNNFLQLYFHIYNNLLDLNEILNYPTFVLIMFCFLYIYITLYYAFSDNTFHFNLLFCLICGCEILISLTLCASLIPEYLQNISTTAGQLIEKFSPDFHNSLFMLYLKRMEEKRIICISSCGMIHLKKKFMLSAAGVILTYELLIINLKL